MLSPSIDALTTGCRRSASTTALTMNDMYVSFAPAPLVFRLLLLADLRDGGEVDLEHRVHVRRRAPAQHHVLGDLLAHHRQLLDPTRSPGRRRRRAASRCLSGRSRRRRLAARAR